MTALRVGIAGYGLAGEVFHAPLVAAVDGLEVSAVMTSSPERAAKAREAYPGVRIAADVDALLDDIDVLVVGTPNVTHVPFALAAIERGLHVVVDKPLASNAADARRLVEAGGNLTVFQNRRLDGDFLTVVRLVADGFFGGVQRFESRFERFRPQAGGGWREQADPAVGGGLLLDLGAHLVDQAVQLFGAPLRVYAEVAARRPGAAIDDDVFVALEHANDVRSHLWMSAIAPLHGPRFRVSGLQGGFAVDGLDPQEAQLIAGVRPGDSDWGQGRSGRLVKQADTSTPDSAIANAGDVTEEIELERGRYEDFYAAVRDWARGEGPAPVDPADSLRVLEILEAARASAERGQTIEMRG